MGTTDELLQFFDEESLSHFYWPEVDERIAWLEDLRTRPIVITPTEDSPNQLWGFDSLIHAFQSGEYELLGREMVDARNARLSFNTQAYPSGGVGYMLALVEAFGCKVTGVEDGIGFVGFSEGKL